MNPKHLSNGWGKTIMLSVIFICSALVVIFNVSPTALAVYFPIATLGLYLIFHVGPDSQLPPPGGPPSP